MGNSSKNCNIPKARAKGTGLEGAAQDSKKGWGRGGEREAAFDSCGTEDAAVTRMKNQRESKENWKRKSRWESNLKRKLLSKIQVNRMLGLLFILTTKTSPA